MMDAGRILWPQEGAEPRYGCLARICRQRARAYPTPKLPKPPIFGRQSARYLLCIVYGAKEMEAFATPAKRIAPALSSSGLAVNSTTGLRTSAADKPKLPPSLRSASLTDRAGAYRRRDGYCRVIHHTNQMEKAGAAGESGSRP